MRIRGRGPVLSWPNRVTFGRLLLLPVFVICLLGAREEPKLRWVTLGLFVLIAGGDFLDGLLARRLGQSSALGAFLDPLADKLTMTSAVILLAIRQVTGGWIEYPIPGWLAVLIVWRDVVIVIGHLVVSLSVGHTEVRPTRLGKATTAAQMVLVTLTLASPGLGPAVGGGVFRAVWYAVALVTVASGLGYLRLGLARAAGATGAEKKAG